MAALPGVSRRPPFRTGAHPDQGPGLRPRGRVAIRYSPGRLLCRSGPFAVILDAWTRLKAPRCPVVRSLRSGRGKQRGGPRIALAGLWGVSRCIPVKKPAAAASARDQGTDACRRNDEKGRCRTRHRSWRIALVAGRLHGEAIYLTGPKQIRVMSSNWAWPAEKSSKSRMMDCPMAFGPLPARLRRF